MSKHIIIIGFASCGKSLIGKLLANSLDWEFFDTDELIGHEFFKRSNTRLSCRGIYKSIGEDLFRELETDILKNLRLTKSAVISTGGGSPLSAENQRLLKDIGWVVYLKGTSEIIFDRMKEKGLPAFLESNSTVDGVSKILAERDPVYSQIADYWIDTSEMTPDNIVCEIRNKLSL